MKNILLIFTSVLLVSCATYVGTQELKNYDSSNIGSVLVKGRTSISEVTTKFGKPDVKQTDEDGEIIYGYRLAEIMYGQENKVLLISFGQNQRVKKYSFIED